MFTVELSACGAIVCGAAFCCLAGLAETLRRRNRQRFPWLLLTLFAAGQAVLCWLDAWTAARGGPPLLRGPSAALLALSWWALLEFGLRLPERGWPLGRRWPAYVTLAALAASGALAGELAGLAATIRYALALPATAVVAVGWWRAARSRAGVRRTGLRWAAGGLLAYGGAAGLVVAQAPFFPASRLHEQAFCDALGLSPYVLRAAAAVGLLCGLWLFAIKGRVGASSRRADWIGRWWCPAAFAALAAVGWFAVGRGPQTNLAAQPSAAAVVSAAAVEGAAAADQPAGSEFEQIMRQRAARNLRLLEFAGAAAVVVVAFCCLAYRFGLA